MEGERGRKAFAAHLAADGTHTDGQPIPAAQVLPAPDGEQMCDVLSQAEFTQEVTELLLSTVPTLLLSTVPTLTGQQIIEVRQGIVEFAKKQGWVDAWHPEVFLSQHQESAVAA